MRHWLAYHPRFIPLLLGALGVAATIGTVIGAWRHASDNLEGELRTRIALRQSALRESLSGYEDTVRALAILFAASSDVSREEFTMATHGLLRRRVGIQALQWVPLVSGDARADFEARASAELGIPFRITQQSADGTPVTVDIRDEYWPITYIQPLPGNERALGYDLAAGPTRETLDLARRTGRIQVTPRFRLIQSDGGDAAGIVVVAPVFRNGQFLGWVQGVFRVQVMLHAASLAPGLRALDLFFEDESQPPGSPGRQLHVESGDGEALDWPDPDSLLKLHSFTVQFGDTVWRVWARPTPGWLKEQRSLLPWIVAGAGLAVTLLSMLMVDLLARRAQWGRRLVAERTIELTESRRRLQEILDFSPIAIFVKDLDRHYTQVNPEFCRLLGLPADEIVGRTDAELFGAQEIALFANCDQEALAANTVIQREVHLRLNGREIWCIVHKFPLTDGRGKVTGLCGVATDISGLKEAEARQMRAERRLQVRQRLDGLAVLAGGIAHDLNNVLAPILLTVDVLKDSAPDDTSRDLLDSVGQSARRGAALVRQVLAFSRGLEGNREPVDLVGLVDHLVRQTRDHAPAGLKVTASLPAEPVVVRADSDQLHRAILNLIVNARDAMTGMPEGTLHLAVSRVEVDALFAANLPELAPGPYATVSVSDTGHGIPEDIRERIFEPFFTTKSPGRGTGLGLPMVDAIVRAHHGAVTVYTEADRGTTLRLYLPALPAEDAPQEDAEAAPVAGRGQTILVVDDEEAIRAATRRTLEVAGYQVLVAADGGEGLEVYREHRDRVALVLTDLVMEGIDGAELLDRLTELAPQLPVLVTSGFPATDRVAKALGERRWRFLPKPATSVQLLRAVADALGEG